MNKTSLKMETHKFNELKRRFEPIAKNCKFCKKRALNTNMEDNCFFPVYKVQNRTNVVVYRNVKFNEVKIGIPRCSRCSTGHSNARFYSNLSLFIGIPLVFIIPVVSSVMFDLNTIIMGLLIIPSFALAYYLMVFIEKITLDSYDTTSEEDIAKMYPLVREFTRNGWSLNRPTA